MYKHQIDIMNKLKNPSGVMFSNLNDNKIVDLANIIDHPIVERLISNRRVKEEESDKVNPTPSQIRMMQQIANGVQVKNLAAYKNYQVSKNRLSNLYEKIGAINMAHAVAILMRQGKIK